MYTIVFTLVTAAGVFLPGTVGVAGNTNYHSEAACERAIQSFANQERGMTFFPEGYAIQPIDNNPDYAQVVSCAKVYK